MTIVIVYNKQIQNFRVSKEVVQENVKIYHLAFADASDMRRDSRGGAGAYLYQIIYHHVLFYHF